MWWDDKDDSEEWQRFKNMSLLNVWGTNKERDEMFESPGWLIISIIIVVVIISLIIAYAT